MCAEPLCQCGPVYGALAVWWCCCTPGAMCWPAWMLTCALAPLIFYAVQLHEEHELVWHDGVAPESALDFDAPHVASSEAIKWWLGGFAFFATVAGLVALTNPAGQKPGVRMPAGV